MARGPRLRRPEAQDLTSALGVGRGGLVALVGGGGKTTLMYLRQNPYERSRNLRSACLKILCGIRLPCRSRRAHGTRVPLDAGDWPSSSPFASNFL